MPAKINIINKQFGYWFVLCESVNQKNNKPAYICRCKCGVERIVAGALLRRGKSRSCGCSKHERIPFGTVAFNNMFASYKISANRRNIEWHLSKEEFLSITKQVCYYCGTFPEKERKYKDGVYLCNGIDRLNSTLHYTLDNVVPCCSMCNYMKMEYSKDIFINHCKKIVDYSNQKENCGFCSINIGVWSPQIHAGGVGC